ncbi:SMC-Scp complex subunit ScpB [Micromonospora sp. WMMD956]|uniref:SMC-Scp complex subunit ScpB n=1 Tax=Micromonospora sp. WMMD956 TaxID=3016108 RepID=UPI0024177425|nr:SMC-Scp complex subunit ScpB [Micromonospora sp. WMMD956]MDG4813984.1 SMC-Scp complex subunit ScpB [Micromonospora sp. WMMD956]
MSDEERRDSLADQAAAWVPPWNRPRPPAPPPADQEDLGNERPPEGPDSSKISLAGEAAEAADRADGGRADGGRADGGRAGDGGASGDDGAPGDGGAPGDDGESGDEAAKPGQGEHGSAGGSGTAGERKQRAPRRRAAPAPPPAPELDDAELRGALEAILLVVDEPVSELTLAQVLEQSPERIGPLLDDIAAGYTAAGHGFELRRAAGGWRLYTRQEYATYVERFVLDGQSVRLTQAALETLAVVAYRQPVTRSRISAIRGVNCDGVLRTLVSRGLVEECGAEPDSGAFLYRTTTMFLEKLGLNSVDELPPLAPFLPDDVEELADATR